VRFISDKYKKFLIKYNYNLNFRGIKVIYYFCQYINYLIQLTNENSNCYYNLKINFLHIIYLTIWNSVICHMILYNKSMIDEIK